LGAKPDDYVDVSIFAGFAYADTPNCGMSVVVVCDRDYARAGEIAERFSRELWAVRSQMYRIDQVYAVEAALDRAETLARSAKRPVVLLEHADRNCDSTHLLRAALQRQLSSVAVPYLWDPAAARAALAAGVGNTVHLSLGGHSSQRAGGPIELSGTVLFAGEKSYRVTGPMGTGAHVDLGLAALVDVKGLFISITSHPVVAIDEDAFQQFGLDAGDFRFIILRSKTHFRAVFEPLAAAILVVDTPDWGSAHLAQLPYRLVPTERLFPFSAAGADGPYVR
jgi:microcystin degradation protein MlrC